MELFEKKLQSTKIYIMFIIDNAHWQMNRGHPMHHRTMHRSFMATVWSRRVPQITMKDFISVAILVTMQI